MSVVGRRPQHASSKLACLVLSSARWCRSSICPGLSSPLVQVVSSACRLFLSHGLQVVTLEPEVHLSFLRRLMCPAQDHFIFLILLIISDFCPLPDPDVILLSILVCAAASLFCACLVSVKCSRRYRSWKRH